MYRGEDSWFFPLFSCSIGVADGTHVFILTMEVSMSGLFATVLFASIVETEVFGKILALVLLAWLYVFFTR